MRKRDHSIWSIWVWSWVLITLLQVPVPVLHDHRRLDESFEWAVALPQHLQVAHRQQEQAGWHLHFCPLRSQRDQLPSGGDPCLPDQPADDAPLVESRSDAPARLSLTADGLVTAWIGALCEESALSRAPDKVTRRTAPHGQAPLHVLICVARC